MVVKHLIAQMDYISYRVAERLFVYGSVVQTALLEQWLGQTGCNGRRHKLRGKPKPISNTIPLKRKNNVVNRLLTFISST